MSDFNRGSTGAGRRRSLGLMPGESTGEGTPGNVIPRGTTLASIRRGQALLRMLNDRLPDGQEFSRGSSDSGRRRNFSLMAMLEDATPVGPFSCQLIASPVTATGGVTTTISWASENYDIGDWWTSGATLTCPGTASYDVDYTFDITQSVSADVTVDVKKNGAVIDSQVFTAGTTPLVKSQTISLTAGDTLEITVLSANDTFVANGQITVTQV